MLEHDGAMRRFVSAVLRLAGHDVVEARSSDEAIERLNHGRVKAVVCDHDPWDDGAFIRHLRSRFDTARVPVVVLLPDDGGAGRAAGAVDALDALEDGADSYVSKPVDGEVLVAKLHAAMRPKESPAG